MGSDRRFLFALVALVCWIGPSAVWSSITARETKHSFSTQADLNRNRPRPGGVTFHRVIEFRGDESRGVTADDIEQIFFEPPFTGPRGNGVNVTAEETHDGKRLTLKGFGNDQLLRFLSADIVGVDAEAHDTQAGIDANFDGLLFDAEIDLRIWTRYEGNTPITILDEMATFEGLPADRVPNLPVNWIPIFGRAMKMFAAGVVARAHGKFARFDRTFTARLNERFHGIPDVRDFDGDGRVDRSSLVGTVREIVPLVILSATATAGELARSQMDLAVGGLKFGFQAAGVLATVSTLPVRLFCSLLVGGPRR